MKPKIEILVCSGLILLLSGFLNAAPKIIIKLDDLSVKNGICKFTPTLNYLVQRQIKAGLGAIANRLDSTALSTLIPYLKATNAKGEKLFEIWNHGLDHVNPEFRGTPFSYQKEHFDQADKLIRQCLGIQLHSFGASYNASDSSTCKVLSENPDYKVFMFAKIIPAPSTGIFYMDNRVNMENGTGNPELDFFVNNYNKSKDRFRDYMTLQGHPNQWNADKIDQFGKIVDFLISEGCEFVLPYEYCNMNKL